MTRPKRRLVSKITITRHLYDDGDILDNVTARDAQGDEIPLVEALGMLRLAEYTLMDRVREREDEEEG